MSKILLHDFVGHAFTAQLARALAARGHDVHYISFASFQTPKGRVLSELKDPPTFRTTEIRFDEGFNKDNLVKRWRTQLKYAHEIKKIVEREEVDIVLSTAPIEVQQQIQLACANRGCAFVFWVQDIHAEAIERILRKKVGPLASLAGSYYRNQEANVLRKSDAVVLISDAFKDVFSNHRWRLSTSEMFVLENWCNLEDVPVLPRDNDWTRENMNGSRCRIIYSGTLARKHNPELLLKLARHLDADIYLFSEGTAPDQVAQVVMAEGIQNLFVRPWLSIDNFPKMLAGADIAIAVIESDAGVFSVPSKVLSYMAAGKPILASIPKENLAALNIIRENVGLVSEPSDVSEFLDHAKLLLEDGPLREALGKNARQYAIDAFEISTIVDQFEGIFAHAFSAAAKK